MLEAWAQQLLRQQIDLAGKALMAYCKKPRSAKRLHSARKQLARLQAALDDLALLAGVASEFRERVHNLHRRAGKVRDSDVLLHRVREYCNDAGADEESEQLRKVKRELRKRHRKAQRKLERVIATTPPELRP